MKIIKLIMAVTMILGLVVAQDMAANSNCEALCWQVPEFQNENGDMIAAYGQNQDGSPACPNLDCEQQARPHPAFAAFDNTLNDDGTNGSEAYDAAADAYYEVMVTPGYLSEDEYNTERADGKQVFEDALAEGKTAWEAWAAMLADGQDDEGGDGDEGDYGDEGDHDDQGGQCRYEGCDFVGSTDDDWRGHCDANPDHCRPQAGDTCGYGHDGGEACDYVFTGDEGEDHHHCDTCGAAMSSGQDMDQHCQDNPEHCRPRAGDTCECGFTFAGTDADENHRHCPTCKAQFDNDGDMGQHCQDNEGHCGDNNDQN